MKSPAVAGPCCVREIGARLLAVEASALRQHFGPGGGAQCALRRAGDLRLDAATLERADQFVTADGTSEVARHALVVVEGKAQLIAAQRGAHERLLGRAADHVTREFLERLREVDRSAGAAGLAQHPGPVNARGDDPQISGAVLDFRRLVGLPVAHRELVRSHARAGLHAEDAMPHAQVQLRQQVHRDDSGLAEVFLEDIALDDPGLVADTLGGHEAACQFGHVRVVFDSDRVGAQLARGDCNLAVAGAEVKDQILRRDLGHAQHALHELVGRRHPHDILAGLSDLRLVVAFTFGASARRGVADQCGAEETRGSNCQRTCNVAGHHEGSFGRGREGSAFCRKSPRPSAAGCRWKRTVTIRSG